MVFGRKALWALSMGMLGFLVFADTTAAQSDGGGGAIAGILGVLVSIGATVGVIYWMAQNRKDFQLETQTSLPPEEAVRQAVQAYTMAGWQVMSHTPDNAAFMRNNRPSCLIAILLFCLGFIPGLIYLFIGGRSLASNVSARSMGSDGIRQDASRNPRERPWIWQHRHRGTSAASPTARDWIHPSVASLK